MSESTTPRGSVVVTGAGGALGRAIALRLGADGFAVGVLGRPGTLLDETAELLAEAGSIHHTLEADLREPAAIYPPTPFLDISLEEYEDVVRVNQTG